MVLHHFPSPTPHSTAPHGLGEDVHAVVVLRVVEDDAGAHLGGVRGGHTDALKMCSFVFTRLTPTHIS